MDSRKLVWSFVISFFLIFCMGVTPETWRDSILKKIVIGPILSKSDKDGPEMVFLAIFENF